MKIGLHTFIEVISKDTGKRSRQPLSYILWRGSQHYLNPEGDPLEVEPLGVNRAVSLVFPRSGRGQCREVDFYVHRKPVDLFLGYDETLQGKRVKDLRTKVPVTFKTFRGDAKPQTVRRMTKSKDPIECELWEVNIGKGGSVHGIYVDLA